AADVASAQPRAGDREHAAAASDVQAPPRLRRAVAIEAADDRHALRGRGMPAEAERAARGLSDVDAQDELAVGSVAGLPERDGDDAPDVHPEQPSSGLA